jgi:hypothetical protein
MERMNIHGVSHLSSDPFMELLSLYSVWQFTCTECVMRGMVDLSEFLVSNKLN